MIEILHLVTQRDQPYGSVRRCCEKCGAMVHGASGVCWTDDLQLYDKPPSEYVNCREAIRNECKVEEVMDG